MAKPKPTWHPHLDRYLMASRQSDLYEHIKSNIFHRREIYAATQPPLPRLSDDDSIAHSLWLLQTAALIACEFRLWAMFCADPDFGGKLKLQQPPDFEEAVVWLKHWTNKPPM